MGNNKDNEMRISLIDISTNINEKKDIVKFDEDGIFCEIVSKDTKENLTPEILNNLIHKCCGDYIYFRLPGSDFSYAGIKKAATLLQDNPKISIAGIQELQNISKKKVLEYYGDEKEIYYSELQLKVQFGWFNFVVRNNGITFDEKLPLKRSYIQYYLNYIGEKGYFGYIWDEYVMANNEFPYNRYKLDDFEDYISFYDFLMELLLKNSNGVRSLGYIQSVIIKTLDEILVNEGLIPETFTQEEQQILKEKVTKIMDRIDTLVLLRCKNIENYHLCYLLSFKSQGVETLADQGKFGVFDNEEEILVWKTVGFRVDSIKAIGKSLQIKGNFQNPACYLMPFDIYMIKNGIKEKISTNDSLLSYRGSKQKIANCRDFIMDIPLKEKADYRFEAKILGMDFKVKFYYNEHITLNRIKTYRNIYKRTMCYFGISEIKIEPLSFFANYKYNKRTDQELKQIYPKEYALREKYAAFAKNSKKVILYVNKIYDEDFHRFYQMESGKKDGYDRYFVSESLSENKGTEIAFTDDKYKELLIGAEQIVTSSPILADYNPFDEKEYKYVFDLMKAKIVYARPKGIELSKNVPFLRGYCNVDKEITY